jgi:hypothetical protein
VTLIIAFSNATLAAAISHAEPASDLKPNTNLDSGMRAPRCFCIYYNCLRALALISKQAYNK